MGGFTTPGFVLDIAVGLELALVGIDLLAFARTLLLTGEHALAEPKKLRYRLHVAARIAQTWPWALGPATAYTRLAALPPTDRLTRSRCTVYKGHWSAPARDHRPPESGVPEIRARAVLHDREASRHWRQTTMPQPAVYRYHASVRGSRLPLAGLALGAAFGAVTSASNDIASPYGTVGSRAASTGWAHVAEVASLLLDAGWAWAALAVAAGLLAGAWVRGAVAGVLALAAAVIAYYGLDSILRGEPFAWYQAEMLRWWVASVVIGSVLGAVGAAVRRPGVMGLIAGLTVPVGATLQMVVWPPGLDGHTDNPEAVWARLIVWVASAVGAAVAVARFVLAKRSQQAADGAHLHVTAQPAERAG